MKADEKDILHSEGFDNLKNYKIFRRRYPQRLSLPVRYLSDWYLQESKITGESKGKLCLVGVYNGMIIRTSTILTAIHKRKIATNNCIYLLSLPSKVLDHPFRGIETHFVTGFPIDWENILESTYSTQELYKKQSIDITKKGFPETDANLYNELTDCKKGNTLFTDDNAVHIYSKDKALISNVDDLNEPITIINRKHKHDDYAKIEKIFVQKQSIPSSSDKQKVPLYYNTWQACNINEIKKEDPAFSIKQDLDGSLLAEKKTIEITGSNSAVRNNEENFNGNSGHAIENKVLNNLNENLEVNKSETEIKDFELLNERQDIEISKSTEGNTSISTNKRVIRKTSMKYAQEQTINNSLLAASSYVDTSTLTNHSSSKRKKGRKPKISTVEEHGSLLKNQNTSDNNYLEENVIFKPTPTTTSCYMPLELLENTGVGINLNEGVDLITRKNSVIIDQKNSSIYMDSKIDNSVIDGSISNTVGNTNSIKKHDTMVTEDELLVDINPQKCVVVKGTFAQDVKNDISSTSTEKQDIEINESKERASINFTISPIKKTTESLGNAPSEHLIKIDTATDESKSNGNIFTLNSKGDSIKNIKTSNDNVKTSIALNASPAFSDFDHRSSEIVNDLLSELEYHNSQNNTIQSNHTAINDSLMMLCEDDTILPHKDISNNDINLSGCSTTTMRSKRDKPKNKQAKKLKSFRNTLSNAMKTSKLGNTRKENRSFIKKESLDNDLILESPTKKAKTMDGYDNTGSQHSVGEGNDSQAPTAQKKKISVKLSHSSGLDVDVEQMSVIQSKLNDKKTDDISEETNTLLSPVAPVTSGVGLTTQKIQLYEPKVNHDILIPLKVVSSLEVQDQVETPEEIKAAIVAKNKKKKAALKLPSYFKGKFKK